MSNPIDDLATLLDSDRAEIPAPIDWTGHQVDIRAAFTGQKHPLDFVLPGLLAGTVGGLFSPGATGKTFLALEVALGIAAPEAEAQLLNLHEPQTGRVVFLSKEDPPEVLWNRLNDLGHLIPSGAMAQVARHLDVVSLLGTPMDIMENHPFLDVAEYCANSRLIIIDTLRRFHNRDENDNGAMTELIARLEELAKHTGAAILFLHHVSKNTARNGTVDQFSGRGASALTDNARWGAVLSTMTDDDAKGLAGTDEGYQDRLLQNQRRYVKLSFIKLNYYLPLEPRWFYRTDTGILVPKDLSSNTTNDVPIPERQPDDDDSVTIYKGVRIPDDF